MRKSKWVSERTDERSWAHDQSKQCGASKWLIITGGRVSKWPSARRGDFISFLTTRIHVSWYNLSETKLKKWYLRPSLKRTACSKACLLASLLGYFDPQLITFCMHVDFLPWKKGSKPHLILQRKLKRQDFLLAQMLGCSLNHLKNDDPHCHSHILGPCYLINENIFNSPHVGNR